MKPPKGTLQRSACAALLSLTLCASMTPLAAFAEEPAADVARAGDLDFAEDVEARSQVEFEVSGSTLTIKGAGAIGKIDKDMVPDYQCKQITHIVIEEGITSISDDVFGAFGRLTAFSTISLPSSLTYIGKNAFASCKGLKSIKIPDGVTTVEKSAFQYCSALEDVALGTGVKSLGDYAFADCPQLVGVQFNEGLQSIGIYAFAQFGSNKGAAAIKSLTIPSSVTEIGESAFRGLAQLRSVSILGNPSVGESAFSNCKALETANLPKVETISQYAFQSCTSLSSVTMAAVKEIGQYAFRGCGKLSEVVLPKPLTSIAQGAFSECSSLKSIEFLGSAPTAASSICGSTTKIIYPSGNNSWTKDVRKKIASDCNNMYERSGNGSLTKAPYICSYQTVQVPFGSSKGESISDQALKSARCFEFSLTKKTAVRISIVYELPCYHGSYFIKVLDSKGNSLFDDVTLRTPTQKELKVKGTRVLNGDLPAGDYHVEVIYAQSHSGKTGYVNVAIGSSADSSNQASMYRLYNPNSGEHFYTADTNEVKSLWDAGWEHEGIAWVAPTTSQTPVYRMYSGTDHHYTMDAAERDWLQTQGWSYEGIGWYSDDEKRVLMHRLFNPGVDPNAPTNNSGSHHYTASKAEVDSLVAVGWQYEGESWYGCEVIK